MIATPTMNSATKKKPGRKPSVHTQPVLVKLSPGLLSMTKEAAAEADMPVVEFIRKAILYRLAHRVQTRLQSAPSSDIHA